MAIMVEAMNTVTMMMIQKMIQVPTDGVSLPEEEATTPTEGAEEAAVAVRPMAARRGRRTSPLLTGKG